MQTLCHHLGHFSILPPKRFQESRQFLTPKAFKALIEVLFKLCDNLKADLELTIGEQEKTLLFFNNFSAEYYTAFGQQLQQYLKMTMDAFVDFFQICHSTNQPIGEQCKCKAAEKKDNKEANQEKDITNRKRAVVCCNNS